MVKTATLYGTDWVSSRRGSAPAIPTRRAGTRTAYGSTAGAELPTAKPARR